MPVNTDILFHQEHGDNSLISQQNQKWTNERRRAVLRDTLKLCTESKRSEMVEQAYLNHTSWKQFTNQSLPNNGASHAVQVIQGDWGVVTQELSKKTGNIYAVLNMANAYVPGGGYLEGMIAQEENMFRRTDCHFHVSDDVLCKKQQIEKNHKEAVIVDRYISTETDLINGIDMRVYLDTTNPRVCFKGPESANATGYDLLNKEDYFMFYELKSAADDLRGQASSFNPTSMRKKIAAQLDTLIGSDVRQVVLSAFGCGAFLNPPTEVARIYREELEKRPDQFDEVVFAIFYPGYGADNYAPFYSELAGVSLLSYEYIKQRLLSKDGTSVLNTQITELITYAEKMENENKLSKKELTTVLKKTLDFLDSRNEKEYITFVNSVQGSPNKGLQVLGNMMLVLSLIVLVTSLVYFGTMMGIAVSIGLTGMMAGLVVGGAIYIAAATPNAVALCFFEASKRSGLSEQMMQLHLEHNTKTNLP